MAEWIREGTRLPEVLSRVLFLEDTVEDARILLVGDADLAPLLVELGATKVVCALDRQDALDRYRAAPSSAAVDYRFLRPGILPGDDGAFDLVIDFDLPKALAAGATFRLHDIGRVLSEDGYALAAVTNPTVGGFRRLFDEAPESEGAEKHPERATYRGFAEAVSEEFELVQVYFQSLLLGFFFGSFDADPGEDGIAPHTGLMGDEAEPASAYLFTFGNAIPEISDVSLVQLPLEDLLRGRKNALVEPSTSSVVEAMDSADHDSADNDSADGDSLVVVDVEVDNAETTVDDGEPGAHNAVAFSTPTDVTETDVSAALIARIGELEDEAGQKDEALSALSARIPALKQSVLDLVGEIETQRAERDQFAVILEQMNLAISTRDVHLQALKDGKGATEVPPLETGGDARTLVDKPGPTAEDLARLTEEFEARAVAAEEERIRLAAALTAAELRLESMAQEANTAVEDALEQERAHHQKLQEQGGDVAGQLQAELKSLREELSTVESSLAAANDERASIVEKAEGFARELATAQKTVAERDAELEQLQADRVEHEEERHKLALGVKTLVAQREELLARVQEADETASKVQSLASQHESFEETIASLRADVSRHKGRAAMLEEAFEKKSDDAKEDAERREAEVAKWRQALSDSEGSQKAAVEKFRAAQAALSERGRELGSAREQFAEVAGQRDTLQQVLDAKARDTDRMRSELEAANAERERLSASLDELRKSMAEAAAASGELGEQLAGERKARATFEKELDAAMARVSLAESEVAAVKVERDALKSAVDAAQENAATAAVVQSEKDALETEVAAARVGLKSAEDAFEDEAAEHERTRDELGAATQSLEEMAATAEDLQQQLTTLIAEHDSGQKQIVTLSAQAAEAAEAAVRVALLEATLEEAQGALASEQARGELFLAQLGEAQLALDGERTRAELFREQLHEVQTEMRNQGAAVDFHRALLDEAQTGLTTERARGELFLAQLQEVQATAAQEGARAELLAATLSEAQASLATAHVERDLFGAELEEAQRQLNDGHAIAALQQALLDDARKNHAATQAQAEMFEGQLDEARVRMGEMSAKAEMTAAQLDEAQAACAAQSEEARLAVSFLEETQARQRDLGAKVELLGAQLLEAQSEAEKYSDQSSFNAAILEDARGEFAAREDALRADLDRVQEALEQARKKEQAQLETLTSTVTRVEEELAEARQQRDALEEALQERTQGFEKEREALSGDLDTLRAEAARLESAEADVRRANDDIAGLREEIAVLTESKDALESKLQDATTRARGLEEERDALASDVEQASTAAAQASSELAQERDDLKALAEALETEKAEAQTRIGTLERERSEEREKLDADVAAALSRASAADQALREAEDALIEIGAERDLLTDAKAKADGDFATAREDYEATTSALKADLAAKEEELAAAAAALSEASSDASETARLRASLDATQDELNETHRLLDEAKQVLEERTEALSALETARGQIEREAEIASDNVNRLRDDVERAQARATAAEDALKATEGATQDLDRALSEAKADAQAAEIRASALGERLAKLERDLGDVERKNESLEEALSQPSGAPVDDNAELREELRAATAACEQAEVERDTTALMLEQSQARLAEAESRAEAALKRAANAEEQLAQSGPTPPEPAVDAAALHGRIAVLEEALAGKQAEVEDKIERINRLTERLVRLDGA